MSDVDLMCPRSQRVSGTGTADTASTVDDAKTRAADEALAAGYGETYLATANIDLGNAGTVRVSLGIERPEEVVNGFAAALHGL